MASYVRLPPTISIRLTKPLERFKFGSFNVTTLKPVDQETKEHRASEVVNNVLELRQLLLCGVQETHWLSQEAMFKVNGNFNAQDGCDISSWKGTIGQHNFPTKDSFFMENGLRLLLFWHQ
jgi:hypothetical protein